MKLTKNLKNGQAGFIVTTELALIGSISVLGLATGLVAVRDAVVGELTDLGQSISSVDQSLSYHGLSSDKASTAGSVFTDEMDTRIGNVVIVPGIER